MDIGLLVQQALMAYGAETSTVSDINNSQSIILVFDNTPEINIKYDDGKILLWSNIASQENYLIYDVIPSDVTTLLALIGDDFERFGKFSFILHDENINFLGVIDDIHIQGYEEMAVVLGLFYDYTCILNKHYNQQ